MSAHRTRWRATLQARKRIGDRVWHHTPSVYRAQCYSYMLALDLCCNRQVPRATRLDRYTALDLFRARPEYRTVHAMALRDRVAALLRAERRTTPGGHPETSPHPKI